MPQIIETVVYPIGELSDTAATLQNVATTLDDDDDAALQATEPPT